MLYWVRKSVIAVKKSFVSDPRFHNEEAAYEYVESVLWPNGPVCPHCGATKRIGKLHGKSYRIGLYKCYVCRKQFTVKIGTIFEDSHVPLDVWVSAIYLIAASKKGISSNELHRTLCVSVKTAWHMSHRIRGAMKSGDSAPFGANGGPEKSDETFLRNEPHEHVRKGYDHKRKAPTLIECDTQAAKSFALVTKHA